MKIELSKDYATAYHCKAKIAFQQPLDVEDEYPLIGCVEVEGKKIGVCWSRDGFAGDSIAFDIIGEWGPQYE